MRDARRAIPYGYLTATLGMLGATASLWVLRDALDNAYVGLVFLLVVAAAAASGGTRPAMVAAVLAFVCWNFFFLSPYYTLELADPREWVMLSLFLVIGLLVGQITGRLRLREEEALARERHTAALYRAIRTGVDPADVDRGMAGIADEVIASTSAASVGILVQDTPSNAPVVCAQAGQEGLSDATLAAAARVLADSLGPASESTHCHDAATLPLTLEDGGVCLPLLNARGAQGVLYARPFPGRRFGVADHRLLAALATNAAAMLERRRLIEDASRAAAEKEVERVKSTLLSSLSHNLKTPLASLTATLTSLRGGDVEWDRSALEECLDDMVEDVVRLTEHIDNLLKLAQLESGDWKQHREWVSLREVVITAMRPMREAESRRVLLGTLADNPLIRVDLVQMSQAVRHLLENALAYSPPASDASIDARVVGDRLEVWVDDRGPGVSAPEAQRIFGRFYRGEAARRFAVRGTGLGLSICREIVSAHGGTLSVEPAPGGGARFRLTLPFLKAQDDADMPPRVDDTTAAVWAAGRGSG